MIMVKNNDNVLIILCIEYHILSYSKALLYLSLYYISKYYYKYRYTILLD